MFFGSMETAVIRNRASSGFLIWVRCKLPAQSTIRAKSACRFSEGLNFISPSSETRAQPAFTNTYCESFSFSTLPRAFSIHACCISSINTQGLTSDFNNPSCKKQVRVFKMLKIKALCFPPCHSQICVSDGAPGPQREAVLSSAVVGHREVHADHLHPHRGPGLPAVRPDIFKTKVRHI